MPTLTTDPSLEGYLVRLSPSGGTSVAPASSRFGAKPSTVSNLKEQIDAKRWLVNSQRNEELVRNSSVTDEVLNATACFACCC